MFGIDLSEMTTLVRQQQLQMRELLDAIAGLKESVDKLTLAVERNTPKEPKYVPLSEIKFKTPLADVTGAHKAKAGRSRKVGEDAS